MTLFSSMLKRFLLVCMVFLVACGPTSSAALTQLDTGVGGGSPEQIVENFFEDLNKALKDPALANESHRAELVDRLTGYFAPNERTDQHEALGTALASYAESLSKLDPEQSIRLLVPEDGFHTLSNDGQYALVSTLRGTITMDIVRSTKNGTVTEYHQEEPLSRIIGRADGTVPTIKIGSYWFLTEGCVGGEASAACGVQPTTTEPAPG